MNTEKLLLFLLALHLFGLILMAGTTGIDYITYRIFWKVYALEKRTSTDLVKLMFKFSRLIGIGAALLILTGFGMMFVTHGVFGEQLWFRIKFALVILLVGNGVFIGRRLGTRQRKQVSDPAFSLNEKSLEVRSRLNRFYFSQLIIFIFIIFLSVFKFN
jgi:uncharacterized membrane protein